MNTSRRIRNSNTRSWARALGLLVAFAVSTLSFEATAKTLKIATLMPEGSGFVTEMRATGERIEKRTGGRLKLKFYPGGVMGNDKTVMRKMRVGQLHGAALSSGPLASVYPDIEIYSLPLFFRDHDEVDYVREHVDEALKTGLGEAGFTALSITDGGFAYLLSRAAISRVEDLPDTKIWIPEGDIMSQTALEIAGVSPIPLPTADVYTALQTGLIDTVAAPPMGAIAFQWHTKVRTMTNVPLMYLIGVFVVDTKTYEGLRPADREILRDEIESSGRRLDKATRLGDASAIEALQNQGIDFVAPTSADELERWRHISVEAMERLRSLERYSNHLLDEMIEHVEAHRDRKRSLTADLSGDTSASKDAPPVAFDAGAQ